MIIYIKGFTKIEEDYSHLWPPMDPALPAWNRNGSYKRSDRRDIDINN